MIDDVVPVVVVLSSCRSSVIEDNRMIPTDRFLRTAPYPQVLNRLGSVNEEGPHIHFISLSKEKNNPILLHIPKVYLFGKRTLHTCTFRIRVLFPIHSSILVEPEFESPRGETTIYCR